MNVIKFATKALKITARDSYENLLSSYLFIYLLSS